MKGILSTTNLDDASLVAKAKASPGLVGRDLVREVMPKTSTSWELGLETEFSGMKGSAKVSQENGPNSGPRLNRRPSRTWLPSISE